MEDQEERTRLWKSKTSQEQVETLKILDMEYSEMSDEQYEELLKIPDSVMDAEIKRKNDEGDAWFDAQMDSESSQLWQSLDEEEQALVLKIISSDEEGIRDLEYLMSLPDNIRAMLQYIIKDIPLI